MYTQASDPRLAESARGEVLIPLIRAAATIGFAIAPCSLGFVIIAVSEHLIRAIMVGDDPEMLVSDLQNSFLTTSSKLSRTTMPDSSRKSSTRLSAPIAR